MLKKIAIIYSVLTAILFILACEKLDVKEDFGLEMEIIVASATADFDVTALLDGAAESSIIDEYSTHIKDIEILEAKYTITNFTGTNGQQIDTVTMTVADETGGGIVNISTMNNILLPPLVGKEEVLPVNQAGVSRFIDLLKSPPHKIQFH
jgi:hypothetical protein